MHCCWPAGHWPIPTIKQNNLVTEELFLFEGDVAHASPIGSPGGGVDADCAVGITGMIRGDVSLSIIADLASTAILDTIEQDRVCDERTECARRCAEAIGTRSPQHSCIIRHGTTRSAVRGSKTPPR